METNPRAERNRVGICISIDDAESQSYFGAKLMEATRTDIGPEQGNICPCQRVSFWGGDKVNASASLSTAVRDLTS